MAGLAKYETAGGLDQAGIVERESRPCRSNRDGRIADNPTRAAIGHLVANAEQGGATALYAARIIDAVTDSVTTGQCQRPTAIDNAAIVNAQRRDGECLIAAALGCMQGEQVAAIGERATTGQAQCTS